MFLWLSVEYPVTFVFLTGTYLNRGTEGSITFLQYQQEPNGVLEMVDVGWVLTCSYRFLTGIDQFLTDLNQFLVDFGWRQII